MNFFQKTRILFIIIICIYCGGKLQAEEILLGDESDGSRAIPVHQVNLYDAEDALIYLDDAPLMPFSPKQTCGKCHNYEKIRSGWHFNASDSGREAGRNGHPWILVDQLTATQIPLSHRSWPGTFLPEQLGLSPFYFIQKFGRQMPGGGVGENDSSDTDDLFMRWHISGKLEINCLSCHDAAASHNQAEFARQTRHQNYRWATAATSSFAQVNGSAKAMPDNYDIYHGVAPDDARSTPPSVLYDRHLFDSRQKVFFDIVREVPNERCYFCHSTQYSGSEKWDTGEDVHLAAGMKCVDCHRNGLSHGMIRGYETEKSTGSTFSCKGCHFGDKSAEHPQHGHAGAPKPEHVGLPTIHFEKLACTACHSGLWPKDKTRTVQTSQAHGLGTQSNLKGNGVLPLIQSPVFAAGEDGKLAPHHLLWPAYWGFMQGDSVQPIDLKLVRPILLAVIAGDTLTDSTNYVRIAAGGWPEFSLAQLRKALDSLTTVTGGATPVYLNGGKIYQLSPNGQLAVGEHPAAQAYCWPFAHAVRPAAQALGVQGCDDCHSQSAGFNFGSIEIPSPLTFEKDNTKSMTGFQDISPVYQRLFAFTFLFRPFLKIAILIAFFILGAILLIYFFNGLSFILKSQSDVD